MNALSERKVEADQLVGLIGERGVTSNYQKVANESRAEMYIWQVLTMSALLTFVAVAIFEFVPALMGGWSGGLFAGRVFVATALTLFAGYAGTQAKNSRDVMRKNRQREMDLQAIGPYLATLAPEQQRDFKLKYADRTFAAPEPPQAKGGSDDDWMSNPKVQEAVGKLAKLVLAEVVKEK